MTIRLDLLGITGLAPDQPFQRESRRHLALVGDERAHGWGERQNIGCSSDIGILAGQMKDDGRQSGSLSAWIFVVRPPRDRPIA